MTLNYPEHRYELGDPVELDFTSQHESIRVTVTHMDVTSQITLFGSLPVPMFDLAVKSNAFHLAGEPGLPTWDSHKKIELVLRIDEKVAQSYGSPDDIFVELFRRDSDLLDASSWYALEAMQREKIPWDSSLETTFGIRTRWAD